MAAPPAEVRDMFDMYGFTVKPEYHELYSRFAGIYEAEEAQRSTLWGAYLRDLREAVGDGPPGEDEAALLARAVTCLGDAARAGDAAPQAAQLLQRLAALVQAGLPMAKRGPLWRLFLGLEGKRQEGEYRKLLAEVEALERLGTASPDASPAAAAPATVSLTAAVKAKAGAGSGQTYCLVADASASAASSAAVAAARTAAAELRRIDTFTLTPLESEESPGCTPAKPPGEGLTPAPASAPQALALPPEAALPAGGGGGLAEALATPASTLQTPQAYSSASTFSGCTASEGALGTGATTASTAASGGGGGMQASPSPGTKAAASDSAERWRVQEYLQQIDKDLHRTFPGHPCMGEEGRAALRRILAAYARRNAAVGYCQGLNFLAACLLLHLPEEDAFWGLAALVEDLMGTSYFDERMVLPQVDVLVFGHLLAGRFPGLARHLGALEVDAASVTMSWFLCSFLNALPLDSTLRVWDLLFFERSPAVLFRCALALVEIYERPLGSTRESSDAYMLLQCCAQMTFDSSRLVDTASCGYAHLRDAGLRVLRQRHLPTVLANLRGSFPSEPEFAAFVASQQAEEGAGAPPGSAAAAACFAEAYQRASSAVLEAEEAAAAAQRRVADGGHLTLQAGSRRSSPGALGSGGSQPASPLARLRQAAAGLSSRLMPSSLPQLLPAGALDAAGKEVTPASSPVRSLAPSPARHASCPDQPAGAAAGAPALRRISTAGRGGGAGAMPSPTAGQGGSAGSGAVLGRRAPALTPFSEGLEGLLAASPGGAQQRPQQGSSGPMPGAWTPPRPAGLPPRRPGAGPVAAVAQSQPATPSELLRLPQPPASHRRAHTVTGMGTEGGHSRRRRRLTINLLLADVRPDLQQPALQAALAIAANPSPRAPGTFGRAPAGGGALPGPSPLGAASSCPASSVCGASSGAGGADDLPVRALRFDEAEEADGAAAGCSSASRRTVTAPAAPWGAGPGKRAQEEQQVSSAAAASSAEELPLSLSVLWHSSDDGAGAAAAAAGVADVPAAGGSSDAACSLGPSAASAAPTSSLDSGSGTSSSSCRGGGAARTPGPASQPQPVRTHDDEAQSQSRRALVATVAALQEEVALAESRRHAAEQEAAAQAQMASDLSRQLQKVQAQVAAKEALVAELEAKLEASGGALSNLDGELRAAQMAVEVEEAEAARQRHQLAAADALIARLMDACSRSSSSAGTSPASSRGGSSGVPSGGGAAGAASSPQSSSGSVAQR